MDLVRDKRLEQVALKIMIEDASSRYMFTPEMFSLFQHSIIYNKIVQALEDGVVLDKNLLISYLSSDDKLGEIGIGLVEDIFSIDYNKEYVQEYAKKLSHLALLRSSQVSLFTLADGISKYGVPELISQIDTIRHDVLSKVDVTDEDNSLETLLSQQMSSILEGTSTTFIKTGFKDFDSLIGGIELSDLAIIAARPSLGKTALMLRWMLNFAMMGVKSEIYSFEMSNPQIIRRILSMESSIPTHRLQSGLISAEEKDQLRQVATKLKPVPLSFRYAVGKELPELLSHIRLSNKVNGTQVFAIDYVQLMSVTPGNETQDLSRIASGLKNLAVELNIAIILLSQLNRAVESRKNKHPVLSDLRQSGGLEENADKVIFPYREYYYSKDEKDLGLAEIILAKNRNGPIAEFHLLFNEETTNFWM